MTKYLTKPSIEISSGMNKMIEKIIDKSHAYGLTKKAILKNAAYTLRVTYDIKEETLSLTLGNSYGILLTYVC